MASDVQTLLTKLEADISDYKSGMAEADDVTNKFENNTKRAGGGIADAFSGILNPITLVGGALVGVGAAAMAVWSDFDAGIDTIATLTGASGPALEGMGATMTYLKGTSAGLGSSMEDIGNVMGTIGRETGLAGAELELLSDRTLKLSQLTGGDAAKTGTDFSNIMKSWGLDASGTASAMDTVFAASQSMGINIDAVTESLTKNGPALRNMGFSLDESVGLLGQFDKAGMNSQLMLKGMQTATADWAKDGLDASQMLPLLVGNIKNAADETIALQMATNAFGAKAAPAFVEGIRSGTLNLDNLTGALGESRGSIDQTLESTLDFSDKWSIFTSNAATKLIPLGDALNSLASGAMPYVEAGFNALMDVLTRVGAVIGPIVTAFAEGGLSGAVSQLTTTFPQLTAVITPIQDILSQVMAVVGPLVTAFQEGGLSGALTQLTTLFPQLSTVVAPVQEVLSQLSSAVTAVASGFAAGGIGGAIESLIAQFPVLNEVISAGQMVVEALRSVWDVLAGKLTEIASQVMPALTELWANLQPALSQLQPILESLFTIFQAGAAILGGVVVVAVSALMGILQGFVAFLPSVGDIVSGVVTTIKGVLDVFVSIITGVVDVVTNLLEGDFTGAWEAVKTMIGGVAEGIGTIISGLWTTIQGLFEGGIAFVQGFVQGFVDTLVGIFTGLYEALVGHSIVTDLIEGMKSIISGGLEFIRGIWDEAWESLRQMAETIWLAITTLVTNKITEVNTTINNITAAIGVIWQTFWDGIGLKVKEIWDSLTLTVTTKITEAQTTISNITVAIKTIWDTFWSGIWAKVTEAWDGIVGGISTKLGEIQTMLTNVPGQITATVVGIGSAIVNGIIQGLRDAWGNITQAIADLAANLPQPIKDALGISSPSEEMADQVGSPIAAGILVGIREAWPSVISGAVGLVQELQSALATESDAGGLAEGWRTMFNGLTTWLLETWRPMLLEIFTTGGVTQLTNDLRNTEGPALAEAWWHVFENMLIHMRDEWAVETKEAWGQFLTDLTLQLDEATHDRVEGSLGYVWKTNLGWMYNFVRDPWRGMVEQEFKTGAGAWLEVIGGAGEDMSGSWAESLGAMVTATAEAVSAIISEFDRLRGISVPVPGGTPDTTGASLVGGASLSPAMAGSAPGGAAGRGINVQVNIMVRDQSGALRRLTPRELHEMGYAVQVRRMS